MTTRWIYLPLALALAACGPKDTDDVDTDDTDTTDTDTTDDTDDTDVEAEATIVSTVVDTPRFSILEAAVLRADIAGALTGGITVFAPNDTAFETLFLALGIDGVDDLTPLQLTKVLTYHVVGSEVDAAAAIAIADGAGVAMALGGELDLTLDGDDLLIDAATVISPDIEVSDGIIHEIDAVLVPSILDVVISDDELTSLAAAAGVADTDPDDMGAITATLGGAGTFTLFAPTDAAFGDLLTGNSLADLPAAVTALGGAGPLADLLSYHLLTTEVDSTAAIAADGTSVGAATGADITVDVIGGSVVLNDGVTGSPDLVNTNTATVVTVDIVTSNGIIHKIDQVIVPPAPSKGSVDVIRN